MKIDYTKSPQANLIRLIKKSNMAYIDETQVEFGIPQALPGVSLPDPKPSAINPDPLQLDTRVLIKAKTGSETVSGSYELRYRRISLRRQWEVMHGGQTDANVNSFNPTIKVHRAQIGTFNEAQVLVYINKFFPILKDSVEITSVESDKQFILTYTPKQNDLIYVPDQNPFQVTVRLEIEVLDLSKVITKPVLEGFEYLTSLELDKVYIHGMTYSGK